MATQEVIQPHYGTSPIATSMTNAADQQIADDVQGLGRLKENIKLRSSSPPVGSSSTGSNQHHSTIPPQFWRCASVSSCADITDATAMGQYSLKQVENSFIVKSSLAPSTSQQGITLPELKYTRSKSLKSPSMGCSNVPQQWSRIRKGIKRRKVLRIRSRRSNSRNMPKMSTESKRLQGQDFLSEETSREEVFGIREDSTWNLHFNSAQQIKGEILLNTNLSHKYQPRVFTDIKGHEIAIKALSKAVEKIKIAHLYLFHGPSGTGKTSTARIFAMALNCESTSHTKPCWSCRGCSRSLYIMDLCSGSRIAGFERIKTLLQSTSFTLAIPGFKVLIIRECHSFNAQAWDELLGIAEREYGSRVVFVLVTIDANMVPKNVSSRCQKFCFPKLKEKEITLKLAKIVACENIRIEKEALKLIAAKSEGSLREAENLLDQLALLGSTITSSVVQQLVGLLPENKLLDLLATAISGDTIKIIRYTRELIATGVEPKVLLSQLTSLITDILSHNAVADSLSSAGSSKDKRLLRSGSQLTKSQSERLCHALKVLVETEKQLGPSSDQNSRILAALLEITFEEVCNRVSTGIVLPRNVTPISGGKSNADSEHMHSQRLFRSRSTTHQHSIRTSEQPDTDRIEPGIPIIGTDQTQRSRGKEVEKKPNLADTSDMEEIWRNMLGRIQSTYIKEFLCHQVKLASLTVSSANIIVHLMFKRDEDKMAAQMSEESISKALKNAIGCPVTVNMSLEPTDLGIVKENTLSTDSQLSSHSKKQQRIPLLTNFFPSMNLEAAMHYSTPQESFPSAEKSRPMKLKDCTPSQEQCRCPSEEKEAHTARPQKNSPFLGYLTQKNQLGTSTDHERDILTREQTSTDTALIMTANKLKHRWLSLSSIPQSDASVEPYSQDILFEKINKERESNTRKAHKFRKGFLKTAENHDSVDSAMQQQLNCSWSCTDIFCSRKTKGRTDAA